MGRRKRPKRWNRRHYHSDFNESPESSLPEKPVAFQLDPEPRPAFYATTRFTSPAINISPEERLRRKIMCRCRQNS